MVLEGAGGPKVFTGRLQGEQEMQDQDFKTLIHYSNIVSEPAMNKILLISQLFLINSKQFKQRANGHTCFLMPRTTKI